MSNLDPKSGPRTHFRPSLQQRRDLISTTPASSINPCCWSQQLPVEWSLCSRQPASDGCRRVFRMLPRERPGCDTTARVIFDESNESSSYGLLHLLYKSSRLHELKRDVGACQPPGKRWSCCGRDSRLPSCPRPTANKTSLLCPLSALRDNGHLVLSYIPNSLIISVAQIACDLSPASPSS